MRMRPTTDRFHGTLNIGMASKNKYAKLESTAKNSHTDEWISVFKGFRSDKTLLEGLRGDLRGLDTAVGFCVFLLKIEVCNAKYSNSFSNAFCHVERQTDIMTQERVAYSFASIFRRGCHILKSYLDDDNYIPKRRSEKVALSNLLFLLMNTKDATKSLNIDPVEKLSETDWTIRLAHHYLSRLSVNPSYVLDKYSSSKRSVCSCCNEKILGTYEDTSIGIKSGWHGYLDIVLGIERSLPVKVAVPEPDSPGGNPSAFEVKVQDDLVNFRDQIISETVVFSFLQKKFHPEYTNFLIPTIGISRKHVVFYFYDSEHDMLMETPPIPLLKNDKILSTTVLAVWLAVNYKYFCSGITKGMQERNFTADFGKQVEEHKEMYEKDVQYACGSKHRTEDFAPWQDVGIKVESGDPAFPIEDL